MSQFSSGIGPGATRSVCQHHPDTPASDRCAGCAEAFCHNCIVEMQGQKYCGQCKIMGLKAQPMLAMATIPCAPARVSLTLACVGIVGLFLFGLFGGLACIGVEIAAIAKAVEAKKMIAANPRLTGGEKATMGMVIGIMVCVWGLLLLVLEGASKLR